MNTGGLEVTSGYKTVRDTGTFSYAAHAVVVSVDTEMGDVKILDYALCEDGGVLINPMIVDGQVCGGVAQGIGTALYEEMPFDDHGQPLATTLGRLHAAGRDRSADAAHRSHGNAVAILILRSKRNWRGWSDRPPAAIANAVNDALRPLGVEINQLPITPHRILEALAASRKRAAA